jgi:trans-aconitate methyltransferase
MQNSDVEWEKWGHANPYYGVTTSNSYLGQSLSDKNRKEFFQSGVELTQTVFPIIEKHFRENWIPEMGVDFGCGVGRLAIPLASRCQCVTGLDVSESMLRESRANAEKIGTANIEFIKSDDGLTLLNKPFDYLQSFHVFQHIPVTRGMRILQQLVARLEPEGCGVIHVPFLDSASRARKMVNWMQGNVPFVHGVVNILKRRPWGRPVMQMNVYSINALLAILSANGCSNVYIETICYGRFQSAVLYFQKRDIGGSSVY